MLIRPLSIPGALVVTPEQLPDSRGVFFEVLRSDYLAAALGHSFNPVQANVSVSCRGTIRGIHFADVPVGQAKYVTVLTGSLLDFIVDLRVGSPTFGQWDSVPLDAVTRHAVYLAEGLGHATCALEDDTTVHYLCSATYNPPAEHGVHPLDPQVGLNIPPWIDPILSLKDDTAPTLEGALEKNLLPTYEACTTWYAKLSEGTAP